MNLELLLQLSALLLIVAAGPLIVVVLATANADGL